jgi:CRP-like cAMP-binding protein
MAKHYKTEYEPVIDEHRLVQLLLYQGDLRTLAEFLDPQNTQDMKMDLERELKPALEALARLSHKKQERIRIYLLGLQGRMSQEEQAAYLKTSQPNITRDFKRAVKSLIREMGPEAQAKPSRKKTPQDDAPHDAQ